MIIGLGWGCDPPPSGPNFVPGRASWNKKCSRRPSPEQKMFQRPLRFSLEKQWFCVPKGSLEQKMFQEALPPPIFDDHRGCPGARTRASTMIIPFRVARPPPQKAPHQAPHREFFCLKFVTFLNAKGSVEGTCLSASQFGPSGWVPVVARQLGWPL